MLNYRNQALSVDERVAALIADMTPAEKAAQLWGVWAIALLDDQRRFVPERQPEIFANGVGQVSRLGANALVEPQQVAGLANQIQRYLIENTRQGIPAMLHEETCAGILMRGATTFPQSIGQAATWQPELIEAMTKAIREQLRAIGGHHALAPVIDVVRDARWGRVEETFGEDPFLISAFGTSYVRGLQGDDLRTGIAATAKHFVGYGASEGGMNWAPSHIPPRELREIYLTPFNAVIKEARIATVMNAYQEIDGIPCGASRELLVDILRGEMGFDGLLVSDYFTIAQFVDYHHLTADRTESARLALEVGMDIELPTPSGYGQPLIDGLEDGRIEMALVDACVERVLRAKFDWGLFDNPYVDEGRTVEIFSRPETVELSRKIAQQSMVLVKNEGGLLPLSKSLRKVAIIGPHGDSARLMQGDYHYPAHFEHMFNPGVSPDAPAPTGAHNEREINWADHFPPTVSVLDGVRQAVSAGCEVVYAQGCNPIGTDTSGFAEAIFAAQDADVAIVVVGDKSGLSKGSTVGESIDRAILDLSGVQQQLVEAVHATGTPTIVVLMNGRPHSISWIAEHVPAVLVAWLPAEQGGGAVSDVLFGDVNPGGKLPISFPRHVGQVPVYYNHKPSGGRSHWQGRYVDMPTDALYPFGHGLSYTQFSYENLRISAAEATAAQTVQVSFTLTNTGLRAGEEVVQLYVGDPIASVTRPVRALKGFSRVALQSGESRTVTFDLDVRHLAFYDREMRYQVEAGEVIIEIGSSSKDIRLTGGFNIVGPSTTVEQVFFTPVRVD